jgi:hypothetical protein
MSKPLADEIANIVPSTKTYNLMLSSVIFSANKMHFKQVSMVQKAEIIPVDRQ